jgi:hypothetical protein
VGEIFSFKIDIDRSMIELARVCLVYEKNIVLVMGEREPSHFAA